VEHRCQQCGISVEDGRPFCPQCRAPQIHVEIAVPDSEVSAGLNPAPDELSPSFPQTAPSPSSFPRPDQFHQPGIIDMRFAARAALKAGLLGLFLGLIPVLGVVLTGAFAVFFYRRRTGVTLPVPLAARIGGASGVVVFAVNALFAIPIIIFHLQQKCIDSFEEMVRKAGLNIDTTQFQANIHTAFTPSGQAEFFILALLLSAVGGALASLFLRPRTPHL
jgi:hypothetical protein